jgi:hypothetical protein
MAENMAVHEDAPADLADKSHSPSNAEVAELADAPA